MAASPEKRPLEPNLEVWQFANCEFDELRYELLVGGRVVDLERKPLDLLRYLLSRSGEVVRKEELLEAVWPGVLVVDASLATAVSKLRKVLGNQEVIQTVSRVGYRIAVPVTRASRPGAIDGAVDTTSAADHTQPAIELPPPMVDHPGWLLAVLSRRVLWAALGLVLVVAASIGVAVHRGRKAVTPQPVSVAILPFQNVSSDQGLDFLRSAVPDQISHTLASARSLTLRPVGASARFADPGLDFRKLGHDL